MHGREGAEGRRRQKGTRGANVKGAGGEKINKVARKDVMRTGEKKPNKGRIAGKKKVTGCQKVERGQESIEEKEEKEVNSECVQRKRREAGEC